MLPSPTRLFGVRVGGPYGELAAVGKSDVLDEPGVGTIFGGHGVHGDGVAGFQASAVGAAQSRPAQRARPGHLKGPMLHIAAVILYVEIAVGVGIDPFDLGDHARNRERLIEVEFRLDGMTRRGWHPGNEQTYNCYETTHCALHSGNLRE